MGREHVREVQRARVISAMTEVAAELGIANTTVADVVARAGVSRRTFYELFDDRDQCFLAALEDALTCAASHIVPAYETPTRWHERIRAALVAFLSFLEAEPEAGRVIVVETLGGGSAALERRKRTLLHVYAAVDEGRLASKDAKRLPPLTAEGLVGGAASVIHARLVAPDGRSLLELTGPLMSMIVLPYLGAAASRGELERPTPAPLPPEGRTRAPADPLRDVEMRLTYRTARVLSVVAEHPGSSNREIGLASGIQDQGQMSKLLSRLSKLGLIENTGVGPNRGGPNAWVLTGAGAELEWAVGEGAGLAR